ncbi:hypothetical protein ASG32_18865 [Methylobacterium sp. Leaf361]|uniref:hypothetical protein n=1 Tax=Methylobacterium sp. Leaf361 TaxID=1736352 RepID=UPI0006FA3FCC|nr:hypothetical protein [Methylobacterium sp. Leaf361]KQS85308.1 hypothetical protein ASG32_18865 [Methylobacterium sp. Leaf361]
MNTASGKADGRPRDDLGSHLDGNLARFDRWAAAVLLTVCAVAVAYCLGEATDARAFATALSVLACVLVASCVSGALAGFLFGIPRLLAQGDPAVASPSNELGAASPRARIRPLVGNSNLEEISDWITKILVGLGLVHANEAVSTARGLAAYVSTSGLRGAPASDLLVMGVGVSGLLIGFLYFYLQTRTRITLMFFATEDVQDAVVVPKADVDAANEAPIVDEEFRRAAIAALSAGIGFPTATVPPLPADATLLGVSFDRLRTSEEFAAWGAAQARARNFEAAETALVQANALDPASSLILRRLAEVRALRGDIRRAVETLREAGDKAPHKWRIRRRELFHALYLPMPDGFTRALRLADGLMQHPEGSLDPMVHVWRACAHGQRHRWLSETSGAESEKADARAEALASLARAVDLSPDPESPARVTMRSLIDSSGNASDNDLGDFANDPEFIEAVDPARG